MTTYNSVEVERGLDVEWGNGSSHVSSVEILILSGGAVGGKKKREDWKLLRARGRSKVRLAATGW